MDGIRRELLTFSWKNRNSIYIGTRVKYDTDGKFTDILLVDFKNTKAKSKRRYPNGEIRSKDYMVYNEKTTVLIINELKRIQVHKTRNK